MYIPKVDFNTDNQYSMAWATSVDRASAMREYYKRGCENQCSSSGCETWSRVPSCKERPAPILIRDISSIRPNKWSFLL